QPRKRARVLKIFAVLMVVAFAASLRATCADDRQSETASLAHDILDRRCFSCHGANGVARKNVFVLDRERLVASHTVIPGDSNSLLLKMVESGAMPLGGPELSQQEKDTLRNWIVNGAPNWDEPAAQPKRSFLTELAILALIRNDLLQSRERNRPFLRYF